MRLCRIAIGFLLLAAAAAGAQQPAPKILLDASPRAIEYQLARLSNDELQRVERKPDDPRYRPVYQALLIRKGLGREYLNEALSALAGMDKSSPAAVLLQALSRVAAEDEETSGKLLRMLFGQPAAALRTERERLAAALTAPPSPRLLQAAYGAMLLAEGDPKAVWAEAAKRDGHLLELLHAVPYLGGAADLRARLFEAVAALLSGLPDLATRTAAVAALPSTRPDTATFRLLAREVLQSGDDAVRAAAIRALHQIPVTGWPPAAEVEPLARAVLASVEKVPADRRTEAASVDAIQLAEKLAASLPPDPGRALRRELRALGVQIVRIEALPEKMLFDLKWFVVEQGKPVQIVFSNPDAMSHNLVITRPGALKDVSMAASTMTVSADPAVKPYVPATPLVLQATRLLNWDQTERLNFTAPAAPGEYPFVCTFPGHWTRMYGVMLVVESLENWEGRRTPPSDPLTNLPFTSPRN